MTRIDQPFSPKPLSSNEVGSGGEPPSEAFKAKAKAIQRVASRYIHPITNHSAQSTPPSVAHKTEIVSKKIFPRKVA
jgi:hypothetical protein